MQTIVNSQTRLIAGCQMALHLHRAFDTDKDIAQTYRVCGLTCRLMAKDCHDRGRIAEEKEQWKYATQYLKRAIWLDPELEYGSGVRWRMPRVILPGLPH